MTIFTDEEILDEVRKIQYFYGLKLEIRYAENRLSFTESVAEHIYGMHVLAEYFMQHEDPQRTWDQAHIYKMITWHDMDELETGDMIGYLKTDADRAREITAMQSVIAKVPELLRYKIQEIADEYCEQKTIESQFVKALDKIEPLFQLYNENGKATMLRNSTTLDDSRRIKDTYVEAFESMRQFNDVLNRTMDKEGFYTVAS